MKETFLGYRCYQDGNAVVAKLVPQTLNDLDAGDVVIAAEYSSINYKDALGATGRGRIFKKFPIIGGIDVAGKVVSSTDARFKPGEAVLVTGCGLGESHDGGYAEVVRVPADWVVKIPEGLSTYQAMIYGTAGFTAGIAMERLLANGQSPNEGPIVVTGASGGVGMMAIAMLSRLGFPVIAVSGKKEFTDTLKTLGAQQVMRPEDLQLGSRPLESTKFGGAIDNVGGLLLEGILRHVNLWGNVASIGMAGGAEFKATVMPHILRGVSILGISSTNYPNSKRAQLWKRLATDLRPANLEGMVTETISLGDLTDRFTKMLARQTHGRTVVRCGGT